ncbi:NfeD family protein [Marinobacterium jannaschii]|uniref:NfeD family protein n=1 Tax=Marinobacterium jannaschii TaxID=64970 RepID=UPI00047F5E73|nr:NfeD family protein [Marinobacterium jannaschii]
MELNDLTHWHWLIIATVLLIAEVSGAAGFLLGLAAAALILAIMLVMEWVVDWQHQLLWYALFSVVFTLLYWVMFRKFNRTTTAPLLNNRAAQLVGRRIVLSDAIEAGEGKVMIGDTYWKVRCETDLAPGARVEVVGSDGMVLLLAPLS